MYHTVYYLLIFKNPTIPKTNTKTIITTPQGKLDFLEFGWCVVAVEERGSFPQCWFYLAAASSFLSFLLSPGDRAVRAGGVERPLRVPQEQDLRVGHPGVWLIPVTQPPTNEYIQLQSPRLPSEPTPAHHPPPWGFFF